MAPDLIPPSPPKPPTRPGLRKIEPYWYPYTTMAKGRWVGREVLEVVSTEFRDRSVEYYKYALNSGVTTINGKIAKPDTVIRNGDRMENIVHRHEPPVTSTPVKILHHDAEREFIVINKPGSIPVHATGRYHFLSLVEILQRDFNYEKVYTVNRLDRLTSGLMIIGLSSHRANLLTQEFMAGQVKKEYIARCTGEFPAEEVVVDQPLLTVDRQMGLNIVHPDGKPAKTIFTKLLYDANTNSSVLHCRPLTGRSHQIRVHLQYLGFPVANDPVYSETKIWGPNLGKGGIDTTPSTERSAPVPPPALRNSSVELAAEGSRRSIPNKDTDNDTEYESAHTPTNENNENEGGSANVNGNGGEKEKPKLKLLPRETGHDIGMGSPVPLSAEAVGVITRLRNMKDEDEDWSRWRDVIFKAKGRLHPKGMKIKPLPLPHRRERGGPAYAGKKPAPRDAAAAAAAATPSLEAETPSTTAANAEIPTGATADLTLEATALAEVTPAETPSPSPPPSPPQLTETEALTLLLSHPSPSPTSSPHHPALTTPPPPDAPTPALRATQLAHQSAVQTQNAGVLYCPECYLPLHPDPEPERLYIFLHAVRYTTSLGVFETEMPEWAGAGWVWEGAKAGAEAGAKVKVQAEEQVGQ